MNWVRLKKGNDWGHDYYALEPHDEHGTARFNRGIDFEEISEETEARVMGIQVRVDGKETRALIHLDTKTVRVPDMGHDYDTETLVVRLVTPDGKEHAPTAVEVPEDWAREAPRNR